MLQFANPYVRRVPTLLVYLIGFVPAALLVYGIFYNTLGADPLAKLEHETGIWALRFLIAALVVTPLLRLTRLNLIKFRRTLGLLGFYYAMLHLAVWVWLDHWFNWYALGAEILKRPFITIGMLAFLILVPLAVTSNNYAVRKMRAETWRRLHWWAYAATALGAIHFLLVVKAWPPEPIIYAGIVAILLIWRVLKNPKKKAQPVRQPSAA